jgi:hypothetical protein
MSLNAQALSFCTRSDLRVVGRNPEMADMDNPRGDIIREVFYVLAENMQGRRWAHTFGSEDRARVERLVVRIRRAWRDGFPLNLELWNEVDPAYGSPAYEQAEPKIVARERAEG